MIVGILGLGLIGGSMARAYKKDGHTVYACDKDDKIVGFAQLAGVVDDVLDIKTIPNCDLLLLAIHTESVIRWMEQNVQFISNSTLVIDCCGIKGPVCEHCFPLAEKAGFTFIGGHPMAGSHNSGFKFSRYNLFHGAPMVLVPSKFDDPELLQRAKEALSPCKFGSFSVTTAVEHDRMIAFTSQMPHIVSNAYIKSPTALNHKGFSAGSYKDLTRVAWLNPQMWAELFFANKENILFELDTYISALQKYKASLLSDDTEGLIALLDEGRRRKEEVDG